MQRSMCLQEDYSIYWLYQALPKVGRPDKYLFMEEIIIMKMNYDLVGTAQIILAKGIL